MTQTNGAPPHDPRSGRWIDVVLLLLIIATIAAIIRTPRPAASGRFDELDLRVGLGRNVHELIADGIPLDRALDLLRMQTGARIVTSPALATRQESGFHGMLPAGPGWSSPVWAHLHDVSLASALDVLTPQGQFVLPLTYAPREDGSIIVGADDEMPMYVRAYDVRKLCQSLVDRPAQGMTWEGLLPHVSASESPEEQLYDLAWNAVERNRYPDLARPLFTRDYLISGKLILIRPRRFHQKLERVFDALSEIREAWPPGTAMRIHTPFDFEQWEHGGKQ